MLSTTPAPESPPQERPDETGRTAEVPMSTLLAACRAAAAVSTPPEAAPERPAEYAEGMEPRRAA